MDNKWIAHVSSEFFEIWKDRLNINQSDEVKSLGHNFYLINFSKFNYKDLSSSIFSRYWLPVEYMWPTKVLQKGFVEKCTQGILKKFSNYSIDNVIAFSMDRSKNKLSSNLRGRILQLFIENNIIKNENNHIQEWTKNPINQPINNKILSVFVTDNCVYAGVTLINVTESFFGGGRHYVGVSQSQIASRAASKCVEAFEYLKLKNYNFSHSLKWIELGAAPGGVTFELAKRGCEVWAVDKANLHEELLKNSRVHFFKIDARDFSPKVKVDGIFCDLNGPAKISADICSQKTSFLNDDGLIIFTYKIHTVSEFNFEFEYIINLFKSKNNDFLFAKHLYNNKQEITIFFKKVKNI
jgi:hypothetical protein